MHASVYQTEYKNMIEYVAQEDDPVNFPTIVQGLFRPENIGDARTWGGELSLRAELGAWSPAMQGYRVNLATGVAKGRSFNTQTGQSGGLASVGPATALTFGYDHANQLFGMELTALHAGEKQAPNDLLMGTTAPRYKVPSYTIFDLSTYWNVHRNAKIIVGVYNLTDRKYWDYAAAQPGRRHHGRQPRRDRALCQAGPQRGGQPERQFLSFTGEARLRLFFPCLIEWSLYEVIQTRSIPARQPADRKRIRGPSHTGGTLVHPAHGTAEAADPRRGRALGVSEAQLLATNIGNGVTRLQAEGNQPREIMRAALDLGLVQAITRNENGVIERRASPASSSRRATSPNRRTPSSRTRNRKRASATSPAATWAARSTCASTSITGNTRLPWSSPAATASLRAACSFSMPTARPCTRFICATSRAWPSTINWWQPSACPAERGIERAGRGAEGGGKTRQRDRRQGIPAGLEGHDGRAPVAQIMREFHLSREQALRLAPAGVVERVTPEALRTLLENAAKNKVAIMVFLGNEGLTQIYSGKIEKTILPAASSTCWTRTSTCTSATRPCAAAGSSSGAASPPSNSSITKARKWSPFGVRERGKPQPQSWVDLADFLPKP
jgi:hypothetical protein